MSGSLGKGLLNAAAQGDTETLTALLDNEVVIDTQDSTGLTPLMLASKGGHLMCIDSLLMKSADLNIQDQSGQTALMHAASTAGTPALQVQPSLSLTHTLSCPLSRSTYTNETLQTKSK